MPLDFTTNAGEKVKLALSSVPIVCLALTLTQSAFSIHILLKSAFDHNPILVTSNDLTVTSSLHALTSNIAYVKEGALLGMLIASGLFEAKSTFKFQAFTSLLTSSLHSTGHAASVWFKAQAIATIGSLHVDGVATPLSSALFIIIQTYPLTSVIEGLEMSVMIPASSKAAK
ncbi:MAG: hypothetical protein WCG25_07340 [bacterium]